ncbi:MAG: phage tail tape measure protein [Nitrincola lacisaponensis]|uniref:phage tail tape measure protein n=1 Tax=Nitrincola lacisaponensis TaxID=267850 RepID=UPI00391B114B
MSAKNLALTLLIKVRDLGSRSVSAFKGQVEELARAHYGLTDTVEKASDSTDAAADKFEDAADSAKDLGDGLTEADRAAGRYHDSAGRLRDANGNLVESKKKVKQASKDAGSELENTSRKADRTDSSFSKLAGTATRLFAGLVTFAGLQGLFGGAIKSSIEFERQLSTIRAASNATAEDMRLLRTAAEDAGRSTAFTATQAGEGLEILARSGYSAAQSVSLLPEILAVAQAETLGLNQAAQLVSDTMSIMQRGMELGAETADILARGATLSSVKMTELGDAISYAGSDALARGMDLRRLVAVLDVLAKNSLRGQRAGTGLRSILADLSDPASKASQVLSELNIRTDDFAVMLDQINALGPQSQEVLNAFGIQAGPALRALLSAGSAGLVEYERQLNDVDGAARTMAEIMQDNLAGGITSANSAWDSLRRSFSDPFLEPVTRQISELGDKFRELEERGSLRAFGEAGVWTLERLEGATKTLYNSFTVAAKGLGVVASGAGSALADIEVTAMRGLNRLGIVSDQTVKNFEMHAGAMRHVQKEFVDAAIEDADDIREGLNRLFPFLNLTTQASSAALKDLSESAQDAADSLSDTGDAASSTADEMQEAEAAAKALAAAYKELKITSQAELEELAETAQSAFITIAESGEATTRDLATAFNVYAERAITANGGVVDATLKAMLDAKAEQYELQAVISETSRYLVASAEDAAQSAGNAFKAMGVTSQQELDSLASSARLHFETIKNSGTATTRDLQAAFQTYAQRAIAANQGVVSHTLKAEAANERLRVEADAAGRVIVEAMGAAARATSDVKKATDDASTGYRRMAQEAKNAGDAKNQSESGNTGGDKKERVTKSGGSFMAGKYSMSDLQALDPALAQRAAEAVAQLNKDLNSDGSATRFRKDNYERVMRSIEQSANAITSQQEGQRQTSSTPEQKPAVSSLDDLSKAMEKTLAGLIEQTQKAEKKVELTLNLPGNVKATGLYDDSEADKVLRSLTDMARISR